MLVRATRRGSTAQALAQLARAAGMSRSAVNRIRRAFGLRPHRREAFRHFLDTVHARTPPGLEPHPILDDAPTHETALIERRVPKHPRVHLHFLPPSAAWRNVVECWFGLLQTARARARAVPQHRGAGADDHALHCRDERRARAVRVDHARGRDPRLRRTLRGQRITDPRH